MKKLLVAMVLFTAIVLGWNPALSLARSSVLPEGHSRAALSVAQPAQPGRTSLAPPSVPVATASTAGSTSRSWSWADDLAPRTAAIPDRLPGDSAPGLPVPPAAPLPVVPGEAPAASPAGFAPDRAGFSVRFKEEVNPHTVMALFALPGERVSFEVVGGADGVEAKAPAAYEVQAAGGRVEQPSPAAWSWSAPQQPGLYPLRVVELPSGRAMTFNAFVLVPGEPGQEAFHGYELGRYPERPLRGLDAYLPPAGFVEVTAANRDVAVAPHLRLGQFVCKQAGTRGDVRLVALRERLLLELEAVLEGVNAAGYPTDRLEVMSGFRTPAYNQQIGQGEYSRHVYGDAADIFIDRDQDGRMDDLNRDGQVDVADAAVLSGLIDGFSHEEAWQPFTGGLGLYKPSAARGPFVHVDSRGYAARWES